MLDVSPNNYVLIPHRAIKPSTGDRLKAIVWCLISESNIFQTSFGHIRQQTSRGGGLYSKTDKRRCTIGTSYRTAHPRGSVGPNSASDLTHYRCDPISYKCLLKGHHSQPLSMNGAICCRHCSLAACLACGWGGGVGRAPPAHAPSARAREIHRPSNHPASSLPTQRCRWIIYAEV